MTPRAKALRDRVHEVVESARAIMLPEPTLDLALLERTFSIRISDAFSLLFAPQLMKLVRETAPRVCFRFVPEGTEDVDALREGRIDIDIGVVGAMGPEVRVQALLHDRFVGVVRTGHPLTRGTVTPERYVEHGHISLSRRGLSRGPIDEQLEKLGLSRRVEVVVPSLHQALAIAEHSDLVAAVAGRTIPANYDVFAFPLPVQTEPITISQIWHPRFSEDPAHRWLRSCVRYVFS
jgi:DNA-binding transcriptional LysR family regulator